MLRDRHDLRRSVLAPSLSPPPISSVSSSSREESARGGNVTERLMNFFAEFSRLYIENIRGYRESIFRFARRHKPDITPKTREREKERDGETQRACLCSRPLSALLSRSLRVLFPSHLPLARSLARSLSLSLSRLFARRLSFSPSRTAYRKTSGSDVNQA